MKIEVRDHTAWKAIFANVTGENRSRSMLESISEPLQSR